MTTLGKGLDPVGRLTPEDAQSAGDFSLRAALLVGLTFLPYAAIPLGANSNVPLAVLVAFAFAPEVLARPRILVAFLLVAGTPTLMLFVQSLFGLGAGNVISAALWFLQIVPFGALAAAVVMYPYTVRLTIRVFLFASAAYASVQKFFLDNGVLPFVEMYDLPGYWSVPDNVEEIVEYVRRPFGWFPESSFMAGSFALAAVALMLLNYTAHRRLPVLDVLAVSTAAAAMMLSQSGSALLTLPVLVAMAFFPFAPLRRRVTVGLLGVGAWALVSSAVLESRDTITNDSWTGRLSSIIAGGNYMVDNAAVLLAGVGSGGSTVLFDSGQIRTDWLLVSDRLVDVFSVSGSIILANGVLAGGVMVAVLLIAVVRAFAVRLSWTFGLLAAYVWIVVSGLTISYDSATWIWALPGICVGTLAAVPVTKGKEQTDMKTAQNGPLGRSR